MIALLTIAVAVGVALWQHRELARFRKVDREDRERQAEQEQIKQERRDRRDSWQPEFNEIRQLLVPLEEIESEVRELGPLDSGAIEKPISATHNDDSRASPAVALRRSVIHSRWRPGQRDPKHHPPLRHGRHERLPAGARQQSVGQPGSRDAGQRDRGQCGRPIPGSSSSTRRSPRGLGSSSHRTRGRALTARVNAPAETRAGSLPAQGKSWPVWPATPTERRRAR